VIKLAISAQNGTGMEDNLFAAIVESEAMVSKYRAAPPSLTPSGNSPAFSPPSSGTRKAVPSDQADDQRPILQQNTVNLPKYRICIDSVDKIVEGTMLTTSYIAYRIRFTRMSDLQSHATWKRYKELSTWFQQVLLPTTFTSYLCRFSHCPNDPIISLCSCNKSILSSLVGK
jgi:hypothetical protein